MAIKTLGEISKMMRKLDICMLTSQNGRGTLSSRPMSNNGDVEYDGNSYFFSYEGSSVVKEISKNPLVNLSFEGKDYLFISVSGKANLIKAKHIMEEHWVKDLEQWFSEGIDTPGIIMIHVVASRIQYWQKEVKGEITL